MIILMALFRKILLAVFGGVALLFVASTVWLYWAINAGSPEDWFKRLISDPIPASVTELRYGGKGAFEAVRCFSFRISPADLEKIMKRYSFEKVDAEMGKRGLIPIFKQYSKIPVGDLQGYEAFEANEFPSKGVSGDFVSRLFLISPSKDHVYCLIGT